MARASALMARAGALMARASALMTRASALMARATSFNPVRQSAFIQAMDSDSKVSCIVPVNTGLHAGQIESL